jgi:quercetin dioxygenase-like cupin family protein
MASRRGFVACAVCSALGLVATAVAAPAQAQGGQGQGVNRIILNTIDFPGDGKVTIQALVEIPADAVVAKHTHPGVESTIVMEGELTLEVAGQPTRTYKPGEGFQVPAGVVHGGKNGAKPTKLAATFIVDKDKPLASPA